MFVKKTAAAIVAAAALLSPLSPVAQDTPVANAQKGASTQKYYTNPNVKGCLLSNQGKPLPLPQPQGNPYGIKKGDTLYITNSEAITFGKNAIHCKQRIACSSNRVIPVKVTDVSNRKNMGTVIKLDTFTGWKGQPIYKGKQIIGVTQGSNNTLGYAILFPTTKAANDAEKSKAYRPLGAVGIYKNSKTHYNPYIKKDGSHSTPRLSGSRHQFLFGSNKVDTREADFAKNATAFTRSSKNFTKINWNGQGTVRIDPNQKLVKGTRLSNRAWGLPVPRHYNVPSINSLWKEVVAAGVPDTKSMKQQFLCHAQGSFIKKKDWKLETGKPATRTQWGQVVSFCNP